MASAAGVHLTTWKILSQNTVWGKGTSRAEIFRKIVLQVWNVRSILNVTLTVSHPKKVQGVAIFFKHFYEKFFFSKAFQAPLKSNIKYSRAFQGLQGVAQTMSFCALFKEVISETTALAASDRPSTRKVSFLLSEV